MKTEKALTPGELAERAKDYDLVLTVEASLADAVNNHLGEEKVTTPRKLVEADEEFRKKAFLKIVENTDLTWKQTSYLLENVLDCWKHTGGIEKIFEYSKFDTKDTRKVVDILRELRPPYSKMESFEISEDSVAVIKKYQFTSIDREVLPKDCEAIESFKDVERGLGEFKIFSSASEIAQSLKENLKNIDPGKAGIVVKPGTKYEPLVKSALESEGIPFYHKKRAKDEEDIRNFLSILETGLMEDKIRVNDVRPIIEQLGISIPLRHLNRKLENIEEGREFKEFLNAVKYLDFSDAVEKYQELTEEKSDVREVVEELGFSDKKISQRRVNELRYYLESFEIETEERSKGVLMADPTQVSQVNREYVFHIGMDTEWMQDVKKRPWIDKDREEEINLKDFKSLIQSGESYFLVQDKELNEKITPCFYLNEIIEKQFSSFSELPHTNVRLEEEVKGEGFERKSLGVENSEIQAVSQSGLNSFVQSPRLFYMDQLVSDADQQRFEKGKLFHMYAEYHANNPGKASSISLEKIVDLMMREIGELAAELEIEDLRTEFEIGVKNIRDFLKPRELNKVGLDNAYYETDDENVFVESFSGSNSSLETEPYFKDRKLGAKGKIDLILNENHLVDYKSSRKKSVQKVIRKSHTKLYEEERFPDFQPLLYITYHRKHVEGKIKFTFLHFLNDLGEKVNGREADLATTITYHPEKFQERKASMEAFEYLIKDVAKSNDRRKTLEKLGYNQYKNFMNKRDFPEPFEKEKLLQTEFAEEFLSYAKKEVGNYKYVDKGIRKALKKLLDYRMENYFKEDADQMEDFLQEKREEINEYLQSRFPVKTDPKELPQRDLILND